MASSSLVSDEPLIARDLTPPGLSVLRGPREVRDRGNWMVAEHPYGYAIVTYYECFEGYPQALHIEMLEILVRHRRKGRGRSLYQLVERFAGNMGAMWITIRSYTEAIGFWEKIGFHLEEEPVPGQRPLMSKKMPERQGTIKAKV